MSETKPIRVLFVDNDIVFRESTAQLLRNQFPLEFEVDCVDNGRDAIVQLTALQGYYDVALLDLRLEPEFDGIAVLKQIQLLSPTTAVIIFTGTTDHHESGKAMQEGASLYVYKPIQAKPLAMYIRVAAELSKLRVAQRERDWLEKIIDVSKAMTQSLVPKQIAREICERVVNVIPFLDPLHISIYDEASDKLDFLCMHNQGQWRDFAPRSLANQDDWGLAGHIVKTGETQFINDLDKAEQQGLIRRKNLLKPTSLALAGVPLISRGKVIGALCAQSPLSNVFTPDHEKFFQAIANQAAVAIDNARQHQETAQRLGTLTRLYDTLASLRSALDVSQVSHFVADNLHEHFQLDTCTIGLFDKDQKKVSFTVGHGVNIQKLELQLKDLPEDLRKRAFASTDLIEVLDIDQHPALRSVLVRPDLKSFVIIPLHGKAQPLGIVTMGSVDELTLSSEQKDLLRALAGQAALALENAQLHEATEAWAQQLVRLNEVVRVIATETEINSLLHTIAAKIAEFLDTAGCSVFLLSKDKQHFELAAATGRNTELEGNIFSTDKGVIGKVYQTRKTYIQNDYPNWPEKLQDFDTAQRAVMGAPIFSGAGIIGVLAVNHVREESEFSDVDGGLLSRLGILTGTTNCN
jgi:GAF domain-containing protein